jgi:single-stranded-DNA-specific exonuclease
MRSYALRTPPSDETRAALSPFDEFTQELLSARGVKDAAGADAFLNPSYEAHLHDPFLLPEMEKAVARIARAVEGGETICIYSDYDCDGIPGGALLRDAFRRGGYAHVVSYVPHRAQEGYGLNMHALDALKEQGVSLVITVDCGITDREQVAHGSTLGLDIIITDHHLPAKKEDGSDDLPEAYAVIDHKRADNAYPFPEICGAATAFKLVQALTARGVLNMREGEEKWLLDLAGIATVADMMPLTGENRALAHYGLLVLRKSRRPGIRALARTIGAEQRFLTEDDIGFSIAPRLNAASRMDRPEDALNLLLAEDDEEAARLAKHLEKLNNERKGTVAHMAKDIKARLRAMTVREVIVMGNPAWRPSLLGLAATSVVEEYRRPVFLWGREGETTLKGSCRSDGSVDVVELMSVARASFIQFGGHKFSGGFSVQYDAVHTLEERLVDAYRSLETKEVAEVVTIDRELPLSRIRAYWHTVKRFAPFGEGNEKPLFLVKGAIIENVRWFGKGNEHVRLSLQDETGPAEAVMFFADGAQTSVPARALAEGSSVSLVVHLEESRFRGTAELRLRIVDILS